MLFWNKESVSRFLPSLAVLCSALLLAISIVIALREAGAPVVSVLVLLIIGALVGLT